MEKESKKLTMSTPYAEMHSIVMDEFEKCGYWVEKWMAKQGKEYKKNIARQMRRGMKVILPTVEYKSPNGNRWINYLYTSAATSFGISIMYDSVCYWETIESFGTFMPYVLNGETCIIFSSGHFWQRLCERTDYKMQGVHTAMKFLNEHRAACPRILPPDAKDSRRHVELHWHGGAGYGVEVDPEHRIFEIRTYINEESMTGAKLRNHQEALGEMLSEKVKLAYEKMKGYAGLFKTDNVFAMTDFLDAETRNEVDEDFGKFSIEETEREMTELLKTMSEEEAIHEYVRQHPVTYYVNKHGKHVSTDVPSKCEVNVRLRPAKLEIAAKADCEEFKKILRKVLGDDYSKVDKDFNDVFIGGYRHGWIATLNWSIEELYEIDAIPFNDYKHNKFLEGDASVSEWCEKCEMSEDWRTIMHIYFAWGFDRGVTQSVNILSSVFGAQAPVNNDTAEEYLKKHNFFSNE